MVLESVGGVDEDSPKLSRNPTTNFSNGESIHLLQCDNDLVENDDLHFAIVATQAHKWKSNNKNSICWGLFVINDNLPVDLKNAQML
jgi:hypothetical protein